MDCIREVLGSKQLGAKIVFLTLINVLIGLWIAFALSYFETKHRLDVIEYQHRLVIEEMIRVADSTKDQNQLLVKDYNELRNSERQQNQKYLSSMATIDKVITELDEIKRTSIQNGYLDRSGRSDYALETAGAQVLSIGSTKLAHCTSTLISTCLSQFGLNKICKYFANGPNRAIQPSIHPGECFAFTGTGEIIIKLIKTVFIDAVSIEHILPQMSPNGNILNAPSNFSVYGIENGNVLSSGVDSDAFLNSIHLGDFQYDINKDQPLQMFQVNQNTTTKSFPIVRFIFKSNHGDPEHTCVYRIRVHGSLTKPYIDPCAP